MNLFGRCADLIDNIKEEVWEMTRSKSIAIGAVIVALVVLPFFSAYGAEKQLPTGTPSKIMTQPPQATKPIKLLPDLIVERVWLDDQGSINFQLKNAGQGEIPDGEHRLGVVRVTYENKYEDFSFTMPIKKKPAVDPKGLLKKPNGIVLYNTGIKAKEGLTIKVVVDSIDKITEANDQNNQATLLAPALGALKVKGKEVQPVPPEVGREIAQKEEPLTPGDKGPGRGGGGGPDISIRGFHILQGPEEEERLWGNRATYIYNGGGEHEDIPFRIYVYNRGPGNFEAPIAITIYSWPPPVTEVSRITPVVTIPAGAQSDYFEVILHQSELIAQGKLSPGKYDFTSKIKYFDGTDWITYTYGGLPPVHLTLTRPHPVVQAIPRAMTLTSEPTLTGTVYYDLCPLEIEQVSTANIEVAGGSCIPRGFISFNLSPLRENLERWKSQGGRTFEIKSATLTLDEYYCGGSSPNVDILFDWLNYGTTLDPGDYMGPMYTNLYTFTVAPGIQTIENLNIYVRYQLIVRNEDRIQFRLRLLHEDGNFCARFRTPCQLRVEIEPK